MKTPLFLLLAALLGALVAGCRQENKAPPPETIIKTGGQAITNLGVVFLIPVESESGYSQSGWGFTYEGPSLRATFRRRHLYVDAVHYGVLKEGDVVNLLNKGKVYINDAPAKPAGPSDIEF